jgi:uncharacterized membrane protein
LPARLSLFSSPKAFGSISITAAAITRTTMKLIVLFMACLLRSGFYFFNILIPLAQESDRCAQAGISLPLSIISMLIIMHADPPGR